MRPSFAPAETSVVIPRPKSPPNFDGRGRRAKKGRKCEGTHGENDEGTKGTHSPMVVPEDVQVRSRESPRAHYAKAFVHCLSFPRHRAFQLCSIGPDSCALAASSTCPFLAFFLSSPVSRPPFLSFFFLSSLFSRVLAVPRRILPSANT